MTSVGFAGASRLLRHDPRQMTSVGLAGAGRLLWHGAHPWGGAETDGARQLTSVGFAG